jgi:hypothetical protein
MFGVHKAQVPLPGSCESAGALVRNCDAANVAPTETDTPLLSSKTRHHFKTINGAGRNTN